MSATTEKGQESRALAVFREMRELLAPFPTDRFHLLVPTVYQERSPLFRPAATVVVVDPEDPRDVYDTPGGGGTLCLHSSALERIGNAAGVDFDEATRYVHDHAKEPNLCEAHVIGTYIDSLGLRRRITASAKSDLREGSQTARVLRGGIDVARQFICERTESRARNRAIRKTCNLQSSYKKHELQKPFVALRFRLDESDPDVKRALIAQGTGAVDRVWGREQEALVEGAPIDAGTAGPEEEVAEGDFRPEPEPAPEPPVVAPEAEAAATEQPPAERGVRAQMIIAHVEGIRRGLKWGQEARNKQPSDKQIGVVAWMIGKAIGSEDKAEMQRARRAVLAAIWGPFSDYAELTNDRISATIDWARDHHEEVRELYEALGGGRQERLL